MAAPMIGVGRRMFVTKFFEIPENSLYHLYDVRIVRTEAELYFPNASAESIILALSTSIHDIWSNDCCLFTRAKFIDTSVSDALAWSASAVDSSRKAANYVSASPFGSLTLMCTSSFLAHYGFSTSTTLYAVRVDPFPIDTVTLGVKSSETFEWLNKADTFTTGLVVSVCQEKILVRKGDMFFAPESPMFDSDSGFTTSMLSDLVVLDCAPLTQGLLTVNTEMIVIRIPDEDNSVEPTAVEEVSPVILSDFASCMQNFNGAFLHSHLLDMKPPKKKSRDESFQPVSVVVVANLENIVATSTRNWLQSTQQRTYDANNTIGLTKSTAVKNGLFDGSFVEIKIPDKPEKSGANPVMKNQSNSDFQGNSGHHLTENGSEKASTSQQGKSAKKDKIETAMKIRTVLVKVLKADVDLKDDCVYVLSSLWFNLTSSRSIVTDDTGTLLIKKFQDSRNHHRDFPVTASASWNARLPVATEVHVSCVRSPNYSVNDNFSKTLKMYFDTKRFVQLGDVLCVDTKGSRERTDVRGSSPVVYFKVIKILPDGYQTYLVSAEDITLFQDMAIHSFVPAVVSDTHLPCPTFLPRTPIGLEEHLNKLEALILPQLRARGSCDELCASILVTGPPGCGKAATVHSVASQLNMHVLSVNCCYELVGDTSASIESRMRYIMHRACSCAPCVVLLRNIDVLGKDHSGKNIDQRVVSCYQDHIKTLLEESPDWPVVVVATTSHPAALSSDMHEGFLHCVTVEAPDEVDRQSMLEALFWKVTSASDIDLERIAKKTAGMVLGDLHTLFTLSVMAAHKRILQCYESGRRWLSEVEQQDLCLAGFTVSQCDVDDALDHLQAAHSHAIAAPKIPNVTWADVGGLGGVKGEIMDTIQLPLEHPELFAAGMRRSGLLFYGPPGTGKTLLAKAVATECSLNFLSVKGPELINMYVGQSEENIREVFKKARSAAPCVVFFDELDALAPNRGRSGDSGGVMDRVVSQLLAELDGLHKSCDVFVIGATNRPDLLDPALLRPGRFDKLLYLGVPETREDQLNIIKALTRKFALADDCHLNSLIAQCSFNLTGADFYALCTDAVLNAIKRKIALLEAGEVVDEERLVVTEEDFSSALRCLVPSVSEVELQNYKKLQCSLAMPMSKTL